MKEKRMIVRVTKTEFESLEEVPTLDEFQQIYDQWSEVFHQMLEDRACVEGVQ